MKITLTSKHTMTSIKTGSHTSRFFIGLSIVCCFLFSLVSADSFAQVNATVAPVPEISTVDYPVIYWKSPVDFSEVLTAEQTNTALRLADPNLPSSELGLYTGYKKMLLYMQEELASQTEVDQIASKSLNKVLAEIPGDPIMQYMSTVDFQSLYDKLIIKLIKS